MVVKLINVNVNVNLEHPEGKRVTSKWEDCFEVIFLLIWWLHIWVLRTAQMGLELQYCTFCVELHVKINPVEGGGGGGGGCHLFSEYSFRFIEFRWIGQIGFILLTQFQRPKISIIFQGGILEIPLELWWKRHWCGANAVELCKLRLF
jgi:hypothetical protein